MKKWGIHSVLAVLAVCLLFVIPAYAADNTYYITANTYISGAPFSTDGSYVLVQTTGQYTKTVGSWDLVTVETKGGTATSNIEYRGDGFHPDIAKCVKVTASIDGGPAVDYTGNLFNASSPVFQDGSGNPMLAVRDLDGTGGVHSPRAIFDAMVMPTGSSIVVNFYYEYTDQSTEYTATNVWEFYDFSGNLITSVTESVTHPKPGDSISFTPVFSGGLGYYKLEGYGNLRWTQSPTKTGGTNNPIVGSTTDSKYFTSFPPVTGTMIHDNVCNTYKCTMQSIPITIDFYVQQPDGSYVKDSSSLTASLGSVFVGKIMDLRNYASNGLYPERAGYSINTDKSLLQQTIVLTGFPNFEIYYDLPTYPLTVHFVDDNDTELADPVTGDYRKGQSYEVPAATVAGYTPTVSKVTGTMPGEATTLYIEYSKDPKYLLTVRFLDENGKKLAEPVTGEYLEGASYTVPAPSVDGYTPEVTSVSGTMPGEAKTLTIRYSKNPDPTYLLTVNFVDENDKKLAEPVTGEYPEGASYTVPAPSVDGYTPEVKSVSGTMPGEAKTLTIHYSKNPEPKPDKPDGDIPDSPKTGAGAGLAGCFLLAGTATAAAKIRRRRKC